MKSGAIALFAVLAFTVLVAQGASAADHDFDAMVRQVSVAYHAKPEHIPLLGFARFVVNVARPYGTRDFRLAVFEDVKPGFDSDSDPFTPPGPGWQLMVRSISRRNISRHNNEITRIFAHPAGSYMRLMILATEHDEATVVQVEVNARELGRHIEDAERHSHSREN
ncbi:MAG: hypothetical protein ACRD4P_10790 [Bryobacteraceae bacterium]